MGAREKSNLNTYFRRFNLLCRWCSELPAELPATGCLLKTLLVGNS